MGQNFQLSTFNYLFLKFYSFQVSHTVTVAVIINQLATTQMVLLTGFRLLTRQHQEYRLSHQIWPRPKHLIQAVPQDP